MSDSLADKARKDFDQDGTFNELSLADLAYRFDPSFYVPSALGPLSKWQSGLFYGSSFTDLGSTTPPNEAAHAVPILVPNDVTITSLHCEVSTAGETGSTVRMGLYEDDGTGYPGDLIVDGGTQAADTTGVKDFTVNQPLTAGWKWVVVVSQNAPTTAPAFRANAIDAPWNIGAQSITDLTQSSVRAWRQIGITGALPAMWTTTKDTGYASPLYALLVE